MLDPNAFSLNGIQILIATMARLGIDAAMHWGSGGEAYKSFPQWVEVIKIDEIDGKIGQRIEVIGWVSCPPRFDENQFHCTFQIERELVNEDPCWGWKAVSVLLQYQESGNTKAIRVTFGNRKSSYGTIPEVSGRSEERPVMS